MNYTKNLASCKQNLQTFKYIDENALNAIDENALNASLLVNREIGFKAQKIRLKFKKKNIAQYALTVGNVEDNYLEKRRQKKLLFNAEFKLKAKNDSILKKINQSLCSCGRDPHFMNVDKSVEVKEDKNGKKHLKGLKSCGNNAACPVCAAKLSTIRSNQLKELMAVGRKNGRSYIQVTMTIPHQPKESLFDTLPQVEEMSRYIFARPEWKQFKELTKCRFVHGGLENMVSFKNGQVDWHPHKNYLLDFDMPINEVMEVLGKSFKIELCFYISQLMTNLGQKYLDFKKIDKQLLDVHYGVNKKTNNPVIKGGVVAIAEFKDDYIAKWGLDAEMTAGIYKNGRFDGSVDDEGQLKKSFHPHTLLEFIDQDNNETDEKFKYQCIMAFQEFVLASYRKHWFYFAKGAVIYYNENYGSEIKVKKDKDELVTLEDQGKRLKKIYFAEWQLFKVDPIKYGILITQKTKMDVMLYLESEMQKNAKSYEEQLILDKFRMRMNE